MSTFDIGIPDASQQPSFSREIVDEVWLQAEPIEGNDDALWRRDEHGNHIRRHDYNRLGTPFGWAISESRAGLKPLHWRNLESDSSCQDEVDGLFPDMPELF